MSQDGFGTRTLGIDHETGDPVEVLTFAPVLARAPEFASAVGERVARLARVRHAMYARTRKIDRPSENALRLVSDHVPGWRLDHVLGIVERMQWTLDVSAVITMLRQLIPAVALFSRHQRDATIGTVGPERLMLTPQGRLVVAEYVLAPGLEKLQFTRERLWREFRVAVPHGASVTRIPPTADVVGIGVVAISLLLGRPLKNDEYLVSLGDLVESLTETSAGTTRKLSPPFATWLARALQFEQHSSYSTVQEAQIAFEEMLGKERSYVTTAAQLDRFITDLEGVAGPPAVPTPAPTGVKSGSGSHRVAVMNASPAAAAVEVPPRMPAPPAPQVTPATVPRNAPPPMPATDVEPSQPSRPAEQPVAPAETPAPVEAVRPAADSAPWRRFVLPAVAALALVEAAVIGWLLAGSGGTAVTGGELSIQSRPAAARISIDGEERGVTPFQTAISPGSHVIEVRAGRSEPRVIPVVIREGVQTGLYVELQSVATVGGLEVRSDPARARVTIAGQFRGETPLTLRDLPPGEVEVVVQAGSRQVTQTVRIEPGITSQLVVPLGR